MWRRLLLASLTCLVLIGVPDVARAQSDEVFVDPDSPTGREYDIPLERVRRDAAGSPPASGRVHRSRGAPLFGEGISGPAPSATAAGGDASPSTAEPAARSRSGGARESRPIPPAVQAAIQQPGAPQGSRGTALLLAAAGGLVLLAGAVGGLLLRRRR